MNFLNMFVLLQNIRNFSHLGGCAATAETKYIYILENDDRRVKYVRLGLSHEKL